MRMYDALTSELGYSKRTIFLNKFANKYPELVIDTFFVHSDEIIISVHISNLGDFNRK